MKRSTLKRAAVIVKKICAAPFVALDWFCGLGLPS